MLTDSTKHPATKPCASRSYTNSLQANMERGNGVGDQAQMAFIAAQRCGDDLVDIIQFN